MKELESMKQLFNQFSKDADEFVDKMKQTERKANYSTLDDTPITQEQWDDYDQRMEAWREEYKGRLTSFEAGMSQPNPPNYFRANND